MSRVYLLTLLVCVRCNEMREASVSLTWPSLIQWDGRMPSNQWWRGRLMTTGMWNTLHRWKDYTQSTSSSLENRFQTVRIRCSSRVVRTFAVTCKLMDLHNMRLLRFYYLVLLSGVCVLHLSILDKVCDYICMFRVVIMMTLY